MLAPTHDQNWGGDPLTYWNGGGAHGYKAPVTLSTHTSYSFDKGAWHFIAIDDSCYRDTANCSPTALLALGEGRPRRAPQQRAPSPTGTRRTSPRSPNTRRSPTSSPSSRRSTTPASTSSCRATTTTTSGSRPRHRNASRILRHGIRAFVVGTGGIGFYPFKDTAANSEARSDSSYGVLRMTLRDGSYDWQFQNTGGTPFTDAGTGTCH